MKILTIGDAHVDDRQNLSRFIWLGKYIAEEQPDEIIFMGDFLSLMCLSHWDQNKKRIMEGKRYKLEIDAGRKALNYLFKAVNDLNKKRVAFHEKQYRPRIVYLEGNHEYRLQRYLDGDPTFEGVVDIKVDLGIESRGWKWIPYGAYYYSSDIGFTHIPFNGGREISGKNAIFRAADCTIKTVVFAHTHRKEVSARRLEGMNYLQQCISVGCYFDKDLFYMKQILKPYWRGVVMLDVFKPNKFNESYVTMDWLKENYG